MVPRPSRQTAAGHGARAEVTDTRATIWQKSVDTTGPGPVARALARNPRCQTGSREATVGAATGSGVTAAVANSARHNSTKRAMIASAAEAETRVAS